MPKSLSKLTEQQAFEYVDATQEMLSRQGQKIASYESATPSSEKIAEVVSKLAAAKCITATETDTAAGVLANHKQAVDLMASMSDRIAALEEKIASGVEAPEEPGVAVKTAGATSSARGSQSQNQGRTKTAGDATWLHSLGLGS